MLIMILKTIIMYVFIVVCYRFMGKKEVGNLSVIDLIVSIMIAELAALAVDTKERSIFYSIIPILVLVIIQITLSYFTLKNKRIRKILEGNPAVIINKGKLNFNIMTKLRYSIDDLLLQLREQGIKSIEDVNYAVLENSGKLSIFKEKYNYPMPLIINGEIEFETLKQIKKNYDWLSNILIMKSIDLKDIFYAFYNQGKIYIITKNELE